MCRNLLMIPLVFSLSACASSNPDLEKLLKITESNMVFVEGGTFMMGDFGATADIKDEYGYNLIGSPENRKKYPNANWGPILGDQDVRPLHKVTLSDFSISKYEVTWEEFDLYTNLEKIEPLDKEFIGKKWRSGKRPVGVSWENAKNYCKYLAKITNKNYDLPTEAQWEYAARSKGKYVYFATNTGRGIKNSDSLNPTNEPQNIVDSGTSLFEVGSLPSNFLGLFDMSGNRSEWVNDWYDKDYYKNSPDLNPQGPKIGTEKVTRGGSSGYMDMTVFGRYKKKPSSTSVGFRCVLNPK